jgi:hypothetical protein
LSRQRTEQPSRPRGHPGSESDQCLPGIDAPPGELPRDVFSAPTWDAAIVAEPGDDPVRTVDHPVESAVALEMDIGDGPLRRVAAYDIADWSRAARGRVTRL